MIGKLLTLPAFLLVAQAGLPGNDPHSIGSWLIAAGAVALILNQSAAFVDRFRSKSTESRIVEVKQTILTEKDLERIEGGSKQRKQDSDTQIASMAKANADHKQEVWEVIRGLRGAVGGIQTDIAAIREQRAANGERLGELGREVSEMSKAFHQLRGAFEKRYRTTGAAT